MNTTQVTANNTKCITENLPSISTAQVSKEKVFFQKPEGLLQYRYYLPTQYVWLLLTSQEMEDEVFIKFQVNLKMQHNTIFYQDMFHCSARTSLPSYSVSGQPDEARILPFSWIPLRQERHHQDTAGRQEKASYCQRANLSLHFFSVLGKNNL